MEHKVIAVILVVALCFSVVFAYPPPRPGITTIGPRRKGRSIDGFARSASAKGNTIYPLCSASTKGNTIY